MSSPPPQAPPDDPAQRDPSGAGAASWRDPERLQLPSERGPRKARQGVTVTVAILISVLLHLLLLSGCVGMLSWLLPITAPQQEPQPESMPVFVVPTPAPSPPQPPPETNAISDRNTQANSPGQGKPQPSGDALPRQAGSSEPPPRGEPSPEPPPPEPETEPESQPPPAREPQLHPVTPEPDRDQAPDKRRKLAEALRGMGGSSSGDWGSLARGDADSSSSGLGYSFGDNAFQIESTADVDWGPWSRKVQGIVRQNWYSVIPVAARVGMKGVVRVRFVVHRDGTLTDYELLDSAGLLPLDQAVQTALVNLSNPLPPLPLRETDEDTIRITYTFIYNLSDERELRAWERQRWLDKKREQGG